ncbi:hypothetical protein BJH93_08630 [Kocuria polaris]|nr:hypothetical protein [Kocuria polaris]
MPRKYTLTGCAIAVVLLSGCANALDSGTDPAPATASEHQPQRDGESSLWHVEGAATSLPEDDPDVIALQRAVALHSAAVDNRSAGNVEDTLDAEYQHYSDGFSRMLEDQNHRASTEDLYQDHDLQTRQLGVAWTTSSLSADRNRAVVGFESIFEFTAGDETYLNERELELDERYAQPREITLVRAGEEWVIDNIEKGPLRAAATLGS